MQPAFLRSLDTAGLLTPERSAGGQRRYSRADLALALQVRELLDQNMTRAAAIRIVSLEQQLAPAHQRIAHLEHTLTIPPAQQTPKPDPRLTPTPANPPRPRQPTSDEAASASSWRAGFWSAVLTRA